MRLLSKWFAKELFVNLYNFRVLMRFSNSQAHILIIYCLHSFLTNLIIGRYRLTTTTKATTRTSHYFNKMIFHLTVLNFFHNVTSVGQSMGYTTLKFCTFQEFP